ncbi:uncharacterized protein LOC125651353 [Ostrea edulis]|uniref:uncharacterized protein LOC125651353 n=1 Tax=Ostrea edulis TaxID=37623 RepID=UPI00209581B5|nr:uncharacterized protein LOC125651353 [Ostrea edulis]
MWLAWVFRTWVFSCVFQNGQTAACNGMGANSILYNDVNNGNVCFWVSTVKGNLTKGQTECLNQGGYLAILTDAPMENAVHNFLDSVGRRSSTVYIGYDVDTTSSYRLTTLSGQEQTYENFYVKTINDAKWRCVSVYFSSWFPEKCDNSYYFLCSTIPNLASSESTTTESQPTTESTSATTESTSAITESTLATTESTSPTTEPTSPTTESTSPTTESTSATTTASSPNNCTCPPGCIVKYNSTIYSMEELNAEIAEIKKELEVEKTTLSSTIRKKTSADDPRPSAKTFGYFGIIIIVFVIGGIVALDFPTLVIELKTAAENLLKLLK